MLLTFRKEEDRQLTVGFCNVKVTGDLDEWFSWNCWRQKLKWRGLSEGSEKLEIFFSFKGSNSSSFYADGNDLIKRKKLM